MSQQRSEHDSSSEFRGKIVTYLAIRLSEWFLERRFYLGPILSQFELENLKYSITLLLIITKVFKYANRGANVILPKSLSNMSLC